MASLLRYLKLQQPNEESQETTKVPHYAKIEIKLRLVQAAPFIVSPLSLSTRKSDEEKKVYGLASCPKHPPVIPWYSLFYNGAGDHKYTLTSSDLSHPHIILHKMRTSKSESVSSIFHKYAHHANLKVLLIIAHGISQKDLDDDHRLIDSIAEKHITIVIIPKGRNGDLLEYLNEKKDWRFEATVKPLLHTDPRMLFPEPPEESIKFKKKVQDIIQNSTCVSIATSYSPNEPPYRMLMWILDSVCMLQNTGLGGLAIGGDVLQETVDLLSHDHFDTMFHKDFIFFFTFAYCLYKFSTYLSYENDPKLNGLINKCVFSLLDLSHSHIMEQQVKFIELGAFNVQIALGREMNIFDVSAKSFVKLCSLVVFKDNNSKTAQAMILSISMSIKFMCYSNPKKNAKSLWQKKLIEYFKCHGITHSDIESFKKGLQAMSIILKGHPDLMLTWKDVSMVFTEDFHSIVILRGFIKECFGDLTQLNEDIIFVRNFFQPVTEFYFKHQSRLGRPSEGTSIEECLNFLQDIVCIARTKNWDLRLHFSESLTRWLVALVTIIDLSRFDGKGLIELLFSHKDLLWESYEDSLNKELKSKFVRQCEYLSPSGFVNIITLGKFDKSEIFKKYLSHVRLNDPSFSITDEPLKSLVRLSSSCLIPWEDFKEIISFFQKVQVHYIQSNCLVDYMKDLLLVDIVSSDSFEELFLKSFQNLFSENTNALLQKNFFEKFNELDVGENRFHSAVMNTIIEKSFAPTIVTIKVVSDLLIAKSDLRSLKNLSALKMFRLTIEQIQLESISCLKNNFEILQMIASSLSRIISQDVISIEEDDTFVNLHTFYDLMKTIPEFADQVDVIIKRFKIFLTNVCCLIESKMITYCHSRQLATHYEVYKSVYSCVTNYGVGLESPFSPLVTKEEISLADRCVQKIRNQLVIIPKHHPELGGCLIEKALKRYAIKLPTVLKHKIEDNQKLLPAVTFEAQDDSILLTLESIANQLEEFLEPILDSLDTLAFMEMNKNCNTLQKCIDYFFNNSHHQYTSPSVPDNLQDKRKVYSVRLKHNTSDPEVYDADFKNKLIILDRAVKMMDEFLFALIENCALIQKVTEIFTIHDVKTFNWSDEDRWLKTYCNLKRNGDDTITVNLKDSLLGSFELIAAYQYIFAIQKTCEGFHLDRCLQNLVHIIDKVNYVKQALKTSVTTREACLIMTDIKSFLSVNDIIDNPLFRLFVEIREGHLDKLEAFARERGYDSDNGMQTFRQEYQLVTTSLLHEEHNELLLNTLQNAMNLLFPFFKAPNSFKDLWNDICQIDYSTLSNIHDILSFVNDGLGLIRTYFNETHGENTEIALEAILSSGQYCFNFSKQKGVCMTLDFIITSCRGICGTDFYFEDNSWSLSKINNFSQKLSFLNFERDLFNGVGSLRFAEFKKYASDLLIVYSQLQHCGHPSYTKTLVKCFALNPPFKRTIQLHGRRLLPKEWSGGWVAGWNEGHIQLTDELKSTKNLLSNFKEELEEYRLKNSLLSFLSSKKLNFLYEKLSEEYIDTGTIVNEIGFLFSLDMNSILSLEKHINTNNSVLTLDQHPAEVVGVFMKTLVNDTIIKSHLNAFLNGFVSSSFESGPLNFSLISAVKFTNKDLMNLILWVFQRIPFYFQLLRCSSSTTEEDIHLFFDRIGHLSEQKYLIMGIDLLRNELQRVLLRRCSKLRSLTRSKKLNLFLVEYSSSLFRHIPWIIFMNNKNLFSGEKIDEIKTKCKKQRIGIEFRKFEVVYGTSGCGKTFYIKNKMILHEKEYRHNQSVTHSQYKKPSTLISINETFNRSDIFDKLSNVPLHFYDMLYYFNISLFLPHESDKQELKDKFHQLVDDVNWFFFDLFVLGYVEITGNSIPSSNYSLCLPNGIATTVYVEVPYWNVNENVEDSFKKFNDLFPALTFLGEKVLPKKEFDPQKHDGAELVCKYFNRANRSKLDHLYTDRFERAPPVLIETIDKTKLSPEDCRKILERNFPQNIRGSKILESLYLRYMERRCKSLEKCYILSYLDDAVYHHMRDEDGEIIEDFNPKNMRSTLFEFMKEEALDFCSTSVLEDTDKHQQVVYDIDENGGVVFKFFCTGQPSDEKLQKLTSIGVKFKPMKAQVFHSCLSAAMNVKMDPKLKRIPLIKEKRFVLTRDFVRKMLIINERRECGVPVVIEGETGVGKTYLLDFLSSLWNDSWNQNLDYLRDRIKSRMSVLVSKIKLTKADAQSAVLILKVKSVLDSKETLSYELLYRVLSIKECQSFLYNHLKETLLSCAYDPVLVNINLTSKSTSDKELMVYFNQIEEDPIHVEAMARVIFGILNCTLKEVFYKMSLHAATTPKEIEDFLLPIDQQANSLLSRYKNYTSKSSHCFQKPVITVFFDEINTCSCPGFIKEVIIDKTVNGRPLAENVFIVAACNPHRGNSLAAHAKPDDEWLNSSYYVQSLPHTLNFLKWNYKQLKPQDEKEYIREIFHLLYENKDVQEYDFLTSLIAQAQNLVREYALSHLTKLIPVSNIPKSHFIFEEPQKPVNEKAKIFSESTVSQRDIQRVFKLYNWLENWFQKTTKYGHEDKFHISVRALFVSLALVYYLRLNESDRRDFKSKICIEKPVGTIPPTFEQALNDELNWVDKVFHLPPGVAPTDALKENIYAILICTMVCIPVLIVGPPGSSKTLSFKIVIDNCQGSESKHRELRDLSTFKYLDPHPYQCSKKSTSTEIETVFERAINRQNTNDSQRTRMLAVVLMDEAGLTESSHESMKVLHHLLDDPKVSFVGISNDVLDAAKTNRAVVVYRSDISSCDLLQLAKHSLMSGNQKKCLHEKEEEMEGEEQVIVSLVQIYENLMKKPQFGKFFGLRDFIHFFTYLGRNKVHSNDTIKPQSIMEALEHNFNGTKDFEIIVQKFFQSIGSNPENLQRRSIVAILESSFSCAKERDLSSENNTRYKLFIDSSEDQSLVRLLFQFGIMTRETTSIHSCSRFPCDAESQKLYTTAAIRHAAMQGDTTLIYQAEEIQECFYDLFNQRFTCIHNNATGEKLLYANVAIGTVIKPTKVGHSFNCAVILSESETSRTKKPFLNRFEKYNLSHGDLLTQILSTSQVHIKSIMINARNKIEEFVNKCGKTSFYGMVDQTIDSLMLSVAPQHKLLSSNDRESLIRTINPESYHCKLDLLAKCLLDCFYLEYGVYIHVSQHNEIFSNAVKFASNSISREEIIDDFIESMSFEDMKLLADSAVKANQVFLKGAPQSVCEFSILLLQELLVVHLHHKLLQLMTPEALVVCNGSDANYDMGRYYTEYYLHNQHHFSMGDLINSECDNESYVRNKKVLCYLRTSQAIVEIIPKHFSYQINQCTKEEIESLQNFLNLKETRRLHTYVMNNFTSQETLISVLRHFYQCPQSESEVLLLVADMNELSKETINHARILTEEAEYSSHKSNKLVFLVLHFPPRMFYNHCYPTLFLNGWSHSYIGRAGEMTKGTFIDTEKWLITCLLQQDDFTTSEHSFANDDVLTEWLYDSVEHCSRTVIIKQLKDFPPVDRDTEITKYYFTKVLLNSSICKVIRQRFRMFWQQEAMLTLTSQIAHYAMSYHSSCSLSQTIQETIQSSFREFTILFLCMMNENFVIHTILCEDITLDSLKHDIAANILSVLPVPNSLKQLQLDVSLRMTQQLHTTSNIDTSSPRFPFLSLISDAIEDIINKAFRENEERIEVIPDGQQNDLNVSITATHYDQSYLIINRSAELLNEQFMEGDTNIVFIAVKTIEKNSNFWDFYMNDVMSRSLTRDVGTFSKTFFSNIMTKITSVHSIIEKMATLHYHLHIYWLDSQQLSTLRLLDECVNGNPDSPVDLNNELNVLVTTINILYTSLVNIEDNYLTKVDKLSHLYYQMITKSHNSFEKMSVSVKTKWIILAMVFHIHVYSSLNANFSLQLGQFVLKLKKLVDDYPNYLQSNVLSDELSFNTWHINEIIIEHYVNHFYRLMKDEEIDWMCGFIDKVMSLTLDFHPECDQLKSKYRHHFQTLLGVSVNTLMWTDIDRNTTHPNPLLLFDDRVRLRLAMLIDGCSSRDCFVYHPPGLRKCTSLTSNTQNILMVPICDAYYDVVLERLHHCNLSGMTAIYNEIVFRINDTVTCESIKKILAIEKQAIIQCIIEKLAKHLIANEDQEIIKLISELNTILDDSNACSKHGATVTDNALIFIMRLLQECRNEKELQVKLVDHFNVVSMLTSFNCLTHIHDVIKVRPLPREHFLPFLSNYCSDRIKIYKDVNAAIKGLINKVKRSISSLHQIAFTCYSPSDKTGLKKWTFNMSVFLSVHGEYILKQRQLIGDTSESLRKELFQHIGHDYYRFVDWILNDVAVNQEFQHFFNGTHGQCLIELVAVVLGSPEKSSHFWCLLFDYDSDFLPGTMSTGKNWYRQEDKVMTVLNDESLVFTYRQSLNCQSLLVLQWINCALQCACVFVSANWSTQIVTDRSVRLPAEGFKNLALSKLKLLWDKIAKDCNLSYDERDTLMFLCVQKIFNVLGTTHILTELKENWMILSEQGNPEDDHFKEALCKYEQIIHNHVFLPAWKSLKFKNGYMRFGDPIAIHMRDLKLNVPQLNIKCDGPLEGFLQVILSSTNLHNSGCGLFTLYQFILMRPTLNIGAVLLPKLVELYRWIHNQLQYKVSVEDAMTYSVNQIIEKLLEQYFPTHKNTRMSQINEMIGEYNHYRRSFTSLELPDINFDMKFYDLLHVVFQTVNSNDVLYKAITDIVNRYNSFLKQHRQATTYGQQERTIPLREVTKESCLFSKHKNFGDLLSYRNLTDIRTIVMKYCSYTSAEKCQSDPTMVQDCIPEVFNFDMIQEEIFKKFIAHKQKIDMKGFWKSFDFYNSQCEQVPQNMLCSSAHYKEIIKIVEDNYPILIKEEFTQFKHNQGESQIVAINDKSDDNTVLVEKVASNDNSNDPSIEEIFHSLNYNSLVSLCSGLYVLLQMIIQKAPFCDDHDLQQLANQTIVQFLTDCRKRQHMDNDVDVLSDIGIKRQTADNVKSGLDDYHYKIISDIAIDTVVHQLKFLQNWLEIGYHDFYHLPFCMKIRIDQDKLLLLHQWLEENDNDKIVTDVMNHLFMSEQPMLNAANDRRDAKISEVLDIKKIDGVIPQCILHLSVEHYVYVHLELRKWLMNRSTTKREEEQSLQIVEIESTSPSPPPPQPACIPVVTLSPLPKKRDIFIVRKSSCSPPNDDNNDEQDNDPLMKIAKTKTSQNVVEFMRSEGFEESAIEVEKDEDMDGEYVYDCLSSDDTLSDNLFLKSFIDRLRFRILFKRWLSGTVSQLGKVSPEKIAKLFASRPKLAPFCEVILDKRIDGEILKKADIKALNDLGISRPNCTIVNRVVNTIEEEIKNSSISKTHD